MEKATTALKVIYTWATFDEGAALDPQHVANLCKKVLDTHPDKEK